MNFYNDENRLQVGSYPFQTQTRSYQLKDQTQPSREKQTSNEKATDEPVEDKEIIDCVENER